MAWTTPGTATAGEVLTAAFWNTQVRDNTSDLRSYQNRFATSRRTSGSVTMNSTNWANVDTALDLTLGAQVGDVIEVILSAFSGNEAVAFGLDAVTVVSGSPVTSFATNSAVVPATHEGIQAWGGVFSAYNNHGGSAFLTLASGDISGGNVVIRLRYRTQLATNKTLFALTTLPLVFAAKNLGPVTT